MVFGLTSLSQARGRTIFKKWCPGRYYLDDVPNFFGRSAAISIDQYSEISVLGGWRNG